MYNRSLVCRRLCKFITYIIKQIIYDPFFKIESVYVRRDTQALVLNSFKKLSLSAISTTEGDNKRGKYWNNLITHNIKIKHYGNLL
jgi:hypothetical protein